MKKTNYFFSRWMLSPQPEAEKGTGENVDSGAPGVTDAPHPADDPLEVIRKGPTEVFQFIEESFGQLVLRCSLPTR